MMGEGEGYAPTAPPMVLLLLHISIKLFHLKWPTFVLAEDDPDITNVLVDGKSCNRKFSFKFSVSNI